MDNQPIKLLCNEHDQNKDMIAMRTSILREAVANDSLVSIACHDKEEDKDVILLAVMTKDGGAGMVQYAPVGQLYYPDDVSYQSLTPPSSARVVEKDHG